MATTSSNSVAKTFGYSLLILTPSFDTFLKYFGIQGIVFYALVGTLLIFLTVQYGIPVFTKIISERSANVLAMITFAIVTAASWFLYPLANSGRLGSGSDADEALIIATSEFFRGNYPYYLTTYLSNPISPMPGSIFLASPFVFLGAIYLQNVVWLIVLFAVSRHYWNSSVSALGIVWLLLACPTVWQNIASGADYFANTIYVMVLMWWFVAELSVDNGRAWRRIVSAVLLGIALSSRANFVLLIPLLFSVSVQNSDWRTTLKYLAICGATCIAVTLPFLLFDPDHFSPMISQSSKVRTLEEVLPFARILVPMSGILISAVLSFQKMEVDCLRFFRNCAIVQFWLLIVTSALYSLRVGHLDLFVGQSGYGMFTVVFAATAGWMAWFVLIRNAPKHVDLP